VTTVHLIFQGEKFVVHCRHELTSELVEKNLAQSVNRIVTMTGMKERDVFAALQDGELCITKDGFVGMSLFVMGPDAPLHLVEFAFDGQPLIARPVEK
jgi:hypothetical protein